MWNVTPSNGNYGHYSTEKPLSALTKMTEPRKSREFSLVLQMILEGGHTTTFLQMNKWSLIQQSLCLEVNWNNFYQASDACWHMWYYTCTYTGHSQWMLNITFSENLLDLFYRIATLNNTRNYWIPGNIPELNFLDRVLSNWHWYRKHFTHTHTHTGYVPWMVNMEQVNLNLWAFFLQKCSFQHYESIMNTKKFVQIKLISSNVLWDMM
jgi:hypothetical protein